MKQQGTFYRSPVSAGVTVWTQPGGPGTMVFPQEQPGERVGLWSLGCGHWTNHGEVVQESNGAGGQVAYVLCPLCSYIDKLYNPASLLDDMRIIVA
jgi:hypothetical protein